MSDNTSFKKVVGESPVYVGELVDPLDVDEISRKIKFILERESLIEDRIALSNYGRKFSWDSVSVENKLIFDAISNA
jgi:glycosyltransferase involved in cell wall biosynthesis